MALAPFLIANWDANWICPMTSHHLALRTERVVRHAFILKQVKTKNVFEQPFS